MIGELPTTVTIDGTEYDINSDFRNILDILEAFDDPNLQDQDKVFVCLTLFYVDFIKIPPNKYVEAYKAALKFIDNGKESKKGGIEPKIMDWSQDEVLLFPAINKVAGYETRAADYIHWWTFLGYYMEVSEGIFSKVVGIRYKHAHGKKLEKWEKEFEQANSSIIKLERKRSDEELENIEKIKKKLNGG